jgi:hypothetical protein
MEEELRGMEKPGRCPLLWHFTLALEPFRVRLISGASASSRGPAARFFMTLTAQTIMLSIDNGHKEASSCHFSMN